MSKPIRLTHAQFLQLADHMRTKLLDYLQRERPNYIEVARRCSQELGFPIADDSIRNVNRSCNLYTPRSTEAAHKGHKTRATQETVQKLQTSVEETQRWLGQARDMLTTQNKEIQHLRSLVSHLYHQLDLRPPIA